MTDRSICLVSDCDAPATVNGFCRRCDAALRRNGARARLVACAAVAALVALVSACGAPLPTVEPICLPASELGCVGDNCDRHFPVCADGYRPACEAAAPADRALCASFGFFTECDPVDGLQCPEECTASCVLVGDGG